MKIEAEGKRICVFINEARKPQLTYDDPSPYTEGHVGFDIHNARGRFRNLKIVTDDKTFEMPKDLSTRKPYGMVSQWWDPIIEGDNHAYYTIDEENAYNTDRCQKIDFRSGTGRVGLANRGMNRWGIYLKDGRTYQGRIYLRGDYSGTITVALQSADGRHTYAQTDLSMTGTGWAKYSFQLKASDTDTNGRFAFWLNEPGVVWVDQVVLLPTGEGLFKGLPVRRDYVESMLDLGMKLLRWGGDTTNPIGWKWKNLIGDPDKRRQFRHPWYPFETSGFGVNEFLDLCEAAGFQPMFELNSSESPSDCADFIEYCNGSETSRWGAVRTSGGRAKPYGLTYLKIGNGFAGADHMAAAADAVHAVDPRVVVVGGAVTHHYKNVPPNQEIIATVRKLSGKVGYLSVLPYCDQLGDARGLEFLLEKLRVQFKPAENSGQKIKLFSQEVNGGRHDVQRTLADMQYLNVCERNSDFLDMVTFCNLSAADDQFENGWLQGRFHFNNHACWLQPPGIYFKTASRFFQPLSVESTVEAPELEVGEYPEAKLNVKCLNVSAAKSASSDALVLKVVCISPTPVKTTISVKGFGQIASKSRVVSFAGYDLTTENTFEQPGLVTLTETQLVVPDDKFFYTFPACSFTIIELKR